MRTATSFIIGLVLQCCVQNLLSYPTNTAAIKVKALKDSINLRARPALTAEVVGQAAVNQELAAKSLDMEWVEVVAPTNIDFWVLGDYLKEGVVICSQMVNVRAGPGINFSSVGQLNNETKVDVRGSHGDWIKIAPPENCSLWVSRSLVEVVPVKPPSFDSSVLPEPLPDSGKRAVPAPPAAVPKLEPKKPEQAESVKPSVSPTTNIPAAVPAAHIRAPEAPVAAQPQQPAAVGGPIKVVIGPPKDLDLDPDIVQGQWKEYSGVLRTRNFLTRSPSDFRLVAKDKDGHSHTLCFIKGNRAQLDALLFRELVVQGREYRVRRNSCPVLVPEKYILK